ncbi:phosphatidylinositol-glycan biosynthesis class X protein-like isoform X2 [Ostrea edulis]|uniref:phosphatidylinositol-glycan biosynthesis class X protein-like isoform X2 n=1 Tax=Ostrea edulis TaxID=37623 RepID=UPI0020961F23|nr:phosphatidylinositol-glycan biosynthesis class X protein-like isoform X2 [Ostrea edulis]
MRDEEHNVICGQYNMNPCTWDLFTKILIPASVMETGCECLIEEELPPGLYIDPYELKNYREKGGPQFNSPAVNTENPKELSTSLKFIIYQEFSVEGSEYVTNVTIPVHVRYHQPSSEGSTSFIQIQNPHIYLLCHREDTQKTIKMETKKTKKFPCSSNPNKTCTYTETVYKTDADSVGFEVPVGDLRHRTTVVGVTLLLTLSGCFYLSSKILYK